MGQEAMKVLFKEPIKEAVKETLAEEQVVVKQTAVSANSEDTDQVKATLQEETEDESEDSGSSLFDPKVVIPAVALLGIALAIRQMGEGSLDPEKLDGMMGQQGESPMEEDMSKSAPTNPENPDLDDDEAEQVDI